MCDERSESQKGYSLLTLFLVASFLAFDFLVADPSGLSLHPPQQQGLVGRE